MASPQPISAAVLANIARSLDAPRALLPVLPLLLRTLPSLGSMPRRTAGLMRDAGLRRGSRVLELACGKGSLAIELSRRFACRVTAVDAYAPLLAEASRAARRAGVAHRITWVLADIHRYQAHGWFDAAAMLGLDPLRTAGPLLRSYVRRGGLYVIDDAFLDRRRGPPAGEYAAIPTRRQCQEIIGRWRDTLVSIDVPTPSETRRLNQAIYRRLAASSTMVARTHPELRPHLREFLSRQRHANRLLAGPIRAAIWVIRKN